MTNMRSEVVTEENKKALYKKAQKMFNDGKKPWCYTEDEIFSIMIKNCKDISPLWKKIHYVKFGHNGSQYISHTKLVPPYEPMPRYEMYQVLNVGLTKAAVEEMPATF